MLYHDDMPWIHSRIERVWFCILVCKPSPQCALKQTKLKSEAGFLYKQLVNIDKLHTTGYCSITGAQFILGLSLECYILSRTNQPFIAYTSVLVSPFGKWLQKLCCQALEWLRSDGSYHTYKSKRNDFDRLITACFLMWRFTTTCVEVTSKCFYSYVLWHSFECITEYIWELVHSLGACSKANNGILLTQKMQYLK